MRYGQCTSGFQTPRGQYYHPSGNNSFTSPLHLKWISCGKNYLFLAIVVQCIDVMSKTNIKKQLKFNFLTSFIQGIMKKNFVNSQKKCIFAAVNRLLGLPRESAFSLFRECELGHFTMVLNRNKVNVFSLALYSYLYDIQQVEYHQKTLSI